MKKWIGLLIVAMLMMLALVSLADSQEMEYGDYRYIVLEDNTVKIIHYFGSDESLIVPDEINGKRVVSIGKSAFFNKRKLKSIILPDCITSIDDEAFSRCGKLVSIMIPNSVTMIGANPFTNCPLLTSIHIELDHPSLSAISGILFDKKEDRLVYYPCAFAGKTYTIPQGTQIIGELAFYGCKHLESITIPDSVTDIGRNAFYGCEKLSSITIPDSVTSIGDEAFYGCYCLNNITLPDSVTMLGANPFTSCSNLTSIRVGPDHPTLATINGVLFDKKEKRLICYPCAFTDWAYTIPQGIQVIGDYAFYGCSDLTSITIPDTVKSIGENAFHFCYNLTSITIPGSVTSIGSRAFSECASLTSITMTPGDATSISERAFYNCKKLTSFTVPYGITSIGDYAFFGCSELSSVMMSDSVIAIGINAFKDCPNLTITVPRNSYAAQYCKDNNLNYTYTDALDWLNN